MELLLLLLKPFDSESLQVFLQTLGIMGKGMLGIFIATAAIIGIIWLINKLGKIRKKDGE